MAIPDTAAEFQAKIEGLLTRIHDEARRGPDGGKPHDHTNSIALIDLLITYSQGAADLAALDTFFDDVKALYTADTAAKVAMHNHNSP